jgi:hypothetical protein
MLTRDGARIAVGLIDRLASAMVQAARTGARAFVVGVDSSKPDHQLLPRSRTRGRSFGDSAEEAAPLRNRPTPNFFVDSFSW